jgi:hypothetical protein
MQVSCVVANDLQSAALLRAIQAEGPDDDVTAKPDRVGDLMHICGSVICVRQEVEHGSVMPNIVARGFQLDSRDVAGNPMNRAT